MNLMNVLIFDLNKLLRWYYNFNVIYNSFSQEILNDTVKYDYDPYQGFKELYILTLKNSENPLFEYLSFINKFNLLKNSTSTGYKITLFNTSYSRINNEQNRKVQMFVQDKFNTKKCKYYNYNFLEYEQYDNNCRFYDFKDIIDIINMTLSYINYSDFEENYESYNATVLFYTMMFALINQKNGGCSAHDIYSVYTDVTIQILWLFFI